MRRPLAPRLSNISCDANALDLDGSPKDALVARFRELIQTSKLNVVMAGGVRDEVLHPQTPRHVKDAMLPQIFNLRPELNASQQAVRRAVKAIVQGNAGPGKHAADASHLSEAAETGCAYFITHDKRILDKRDELRSALPPSLTIVTLAEFLGIYDDYEAGRRL